MSFGTDMILLHHDLDINALSPIECIHLEFGQSSSASFSQVSYYAETCLKINIYQINFKYKNTHSTNYMKYCIICIILEKDGMVSTYRFIIGLGIISPQMS